MRVIGLISGTSHDGIDAVLVDFESQGEVLTAKVVDQVGRKYSSDLRAAILAALPPNQTTIEEVCRLDTLIGQEFASLAKDLVEKNGPVDLVSSHGQTMYHLVEGKEVLGTLQLGQPAWIAAASKAAVLSDLRIQDIVSGGQGAPVVPILDLLTLSAEPGIVGSLNLGGIANITVVANGKVLSAFDTGPASALIDAVVVKHGLNPKGYDESGEIAASGTISQQLLTALLADDYYKLPAPKSTGKELFHIRYLDAVIEGLDLKITPQDLVATVTELTAQTVADALIANNVEKLVAAGGGVANRTMISSIEHKTGLSVKKFAEYGIDGDYKEALAMALIGWLSVNNIPATLEETTGATPPPVLGRLTPGPRGYWLPAAGANKPTKLVISNV